MQDSNLVSLEIAGGSHKIRLYRDASDGSWFIARRRGRQYELFRGGAEKSIWHNEEALVEQDPIRLLQIFTLACATIAREYALADFLRQNHERYANLLSRFSENRLNNDEKLSILEQTTENPDTQEP